MCLILEQFLQGNKKGPIKRWDFETEEDYHSYMENREALPKLVKFAYKCKQPKASFQVWWVQNP